MRVFHPSDTGILTFDRENRSCPRFRTLASLAGSAEGKCVEGRDGTGAKVTAVQGHVVSEGDDEGGKRET